MLQSGKILIMDLDNTLVKTNTTFEFIKILCPLRYIIFSRLLKPLLLLNMAFKKDFYKLMMIMLCIKGRKKEDLERYAKVYYAIIEKNWSKYYNISILHLLQTKTWKTKVLLTASLDFIANNFNKLGFGFIVASKSYYKNKKFHSFLDLYGRKSEVIETFLKFFDKIVIIDDNPEPAFYTFNKKVVVIRFS